MKKMKLTILKELNILASDDEFEYSYLVLKGELINENVIPKLHYSI